jgi:hypothetical protein
MTCTPVKLADGSRAIICSGRRARRRCCGCGKPADLLCDWKVKGKVSGTCDTPICSLCTHVPAPGKDLCPTHRDQWLARQAGKAAA